MKHKRFTISNYYEHEPLRNEETEKPVTPLDGYNTIRGVLKWCNDNAVCISMVLLTEWDLDIVDAYGIPEIIASVNLDCAIADKVKDLSSYQYC